MSGFKSLLGSLRNALVPGAGGPNTAKGRTRSRVVIVPPKSTVVRYVDRLVAVLADEGRDVTLRASQPLTRWAAEDGEPPSFQQVLNRLKVQCGLNPLAYPEAIRGRFAVVLGRRTLEVTGYFDDRGADPLCRLSVQARPSDSAETGRE
jgi:hypothetical protein